jgi:uncharacterized protein with PIN domain
MSISNDIDEVSICIVCPFCKTKSPKDWIVKHLESTKKPKIRKSQVFFKCVKCNETTRVSDKKLIKFIDTQVMRSEEY